MTHYWMVAFLIAVFWSGPATAQQLTTENNIDYLGGDYTNFVPRTRNFKECNRACRRAGQRCQAYTYLRPNTQNPRGRCYLKSVAQNRRENTCCISGRRKDTAQPTTEQDDAPETRVIGTVEQVYDPPSPPQPPDQTVVGTAQQQAPSFEAEPDVTVIGTAAQQEATTVIGPLAALPLESNIQYFGNDYRDFEPKHAGVESCRNACNQDTQCQAFTYERPSLSRPTGRCHLKSSAGKRRAAACCISGRRRD